MKLFTSPLSDAFETVANQRVPFFAYHKAFGLRKSFQLAYGLIPNLAINKTVIFDKLQELLPHGHITKMNAAALLCALSVNHQHSHSDPVTFLNNFLRLYNAKTFEQVCEIEEVKKGSQDYQDLQKLWNNTNGSNTKRLEAVKIRCWAKDLERATQGNFFNRWRGSIQSVAVKEVENLLSHYRPPEGDVALYEEDGKKTLSAFPKKEFLPILVEKRANNHITETQTGIILSIILHSRETRKNSGESYVVHPMAVANLVRKHGKRFFGSDNNSIWKAILVALLHDGGEKSNIHLDKDLVGLLPEDVIQAVKSIHKNEGESYFNYVMRCAENQISAFVKLCDTYHNSLDNQQPTFKQEYVYPISSLYVEYKLKNPKSNISNKYFAVNHMGICSLEQFDKISNLADTNSKISIFDSRRLIGKIRIIRTIKDVFLKETEDLPDANSRREENSSLHL